MSKTLQTLTEPETEKLLAELLPYHATVEQRFKGIRNHCMGLLMLDAGLRVGEVVKLRQRDLIFQGNPVQSVCVTIGIAKGARERIIPLTPRLQTAIKSMQDQWWNERGCDGTFAFYSANGLDGHLSTRQVERIIKTSAIMAIGRPVHPHVLRHTFASRLMRTTSMRIVQQLLGHKNLSSTQIYTHPNNVDLRNAINSMQ